MATAGPRPSIFSKTAPHFVPKEKHKQRKKACLLATATPDIYFPSPTIVRMWLGEQHGYVSRFSPTPRQDRQYQTHHTLTIYHRSAPPTYIQCGTTLKDWVQSSDWMSYKPSFCDQFLDHLQCFITWIRRRFAKPLLPNSWGRLHAKIKYNLISLGSTRSRASADVCL